MPYVGGQDVVNLVVDDFDGTTQVALAVTDPSGVTTSHTATTADAGNSWQASLTYNAAGVWVLLWTVTGAGANVKPLPVFVSPGPAAGGPTWRPDLPAVAKYVPGRTLTINRVAATNEPQRTFDDTTRPTGQEVDGLITDAVAWVLTATGPIATTPTSLADMASAAAAIWAASAVERGYPDGSTEDVKTAADLLALATTMRKDLACANEAATGEDPTNPTAALLPIYSFPRAKRWGDGEFN
jgi:hypothetical protein